MSRLATGWNYAWPRVGLLMFGGAIGYAIGVASRSPRAMPLSLGEIVSATGALLGALLAVLGANLVEDRKRRIERISEHELLRGALLELRSSFRQSQTVPEVNPNQKKRHMKSTLRRYEDARHILNFAVDQSNLRIRSLTLFRALLELRRVLEENDALISRSARSLQGDTINLELVGRARDRLARLGATTNPYIEIAIAALEA